MSHIPNSFSVPLRIIRRAMPLIGSVTLGSVVAGPFPPAAGLPGSDAVAAGDPRIVGWATAVAALVRGPEEIDDPLSEPASYGSGQSALGPADVGREDQPPPDAAGPFPSVSLGDGGSIILEFSPPIADRPGPDLAVFENGLSFAVGTSARYFMELAFVEVSSDGGTFTRFPAFSETPTATQVNSYGAVDPTDLRNLAGKYLAGWGTSFDLAELAGIPGLDITHITQVRVVDVVGSLDPRHARRDSLGRIVNDPWPTYLTTSGFDLDAIAVLNQAVTTYGAWRRQFDWTAASSAPAADPDDDGVPNVLEYAFGTSPRGPSPAPAITLARRDGVWTASFPECRTGITDLVCGIETSSDLKSWRARPGLLPMVLDSTPGDHAGFLRVTATLTTPP